MAKFITTSFVLVLIVVAFLNGAYSVDEGEGRGNYKLRKDDPNLYKSKMYGPQVDCKFLYGECIDFQTECDRYVKLCANTRW